MAAATKQEISKGLPAFSFVSDVNSIEFDRGRVQLAVRNFPKYI